MKAKARPKLAAKRALQRRMADEDAEQAEEVEGRPGYFLCSKCHAEFRKRDLQQHFLFVEDLGMPTSRACFVARFWEVYWPGKTTKAIPIHMKRWLQA